MPVFQLSEDLIFPDPEYAEEDGLLAVGGDLSEDRLLLAYEMGIFPWYSEGSPILWWSPDPRLVLMPEKLKVSRSLRQVQKKKLFRVTMDTAFEATIRSCADVHAGKSEGTWITDEMVEAYCNLHKSGFAHSVETWHDDELVGGLYGVSLGSAFFGESMFNLMSNASKVAMVHLVGHLRRWGFRLLDCQVTTAHLKVMGAEEIPRTRFLSLLGKCINEPAHSGRWSFDSR